MSTLTWSLTSVTIRGNPNHAPSGSPAGGQFTGGLGESGIVLAHDDPKIGTRVRQAEAWIQKGEYERASAWDVDGNEILNGETQHKTDRVNFTTGQLKQLDDGVLTHNHPNGSGPSPQDIGLAIQWDMREIRVVTPDGDLYSVRRPKMRWPPLADYQTQGQDIADKVLDEWSAKWVPNMNAEEKQRLNRDALHAVNTAVSKHLGIPYTYIPHHANAH